MQESSSEAVNGYYGVYLLGLARGDTALADWGRLLLATELRSAKKYVILTLNPYILKYFPAMGAYAVGASPFHLCLLALDSLKESTHLLAILCHEMSLSSEDPVN
jgi:hypothetical protein